MIGSDQGVREKLILCGTEKAHYLRVVHNYGFHVYQPHVYPQSRATDGHLEPPSDVFVGAITLKIVVGEFFTASTATRGQICASLLRQENRRRFRRRQER